MSLFLVAGDPSGDRHGAKLVQALRRDAPELELCGLGGDGMAAAGMRLLYNLPHRMAIMGFWQVLFRLPRIGRILDQVRRHLDRHPPRAVVLIDYPGFNFQVAEMCHRRGIPVLYYITPQVWAWAPWRVRNLARLVSKLLVIFPFEEKLYQEKEVPVRFVGHPLCDQLDAFTPDEQAIEALSAGRPILGLLPGSRSQEIRGVLPTMLRAAERINEQQGPISVVLAAASARHLPALEALTADCALPVQIVLDQTHSVMQLSRVCLVASGTATLETAYLGTPMVILYRLSRLSKLALRCIPLLTVAHIGLANIVAGREVVPEHLFSGDISAKVAEQVAGLWQGPRRAECEAGLAGVRQSLQTSRPASDAAAEEIISFLADCR